MTDHVGATPPDPEKVRRIGQSIMPALYRITLSGAIRLLGRIKDNLRGSASAREISTTWRYSKPELKGDAWTASVSSDHPRAALREYGSEALLGGPIRPRWNPVQPFAPRAGQPTRALAVPVGEGRKPSGLSRGNPQVYKRDLFAIYRKGKDPLLATRRADGGIDVRFVLKRGVSVGPHPYAIPALKATQAELTAEFRAVIESAVRSAR